MDYFENGSGQRPTHPALHHHRARLSAGEESASRQARPGKPAPRSPRPQRNGRSSARRLTGQAVTQQLGRAQRHPSEQKAGSRDLPGLMQGSPQPDGSDAPGASLASLRSWRMPATRPPLDGEVTAMDGYGASDHAGATGQTVSINGRSSGAGQRHLSQNDANGHHVRHLNGTPPVPADRDYRPISDELAIAPKISVVLPVLNEAANLPGVFASVPGWVDEVVLVDGRSTDDTIEVARRLRPDVKVVLQGGVGKGDALAAGFAAATGDIMVAIDGDGSTDGKEIIRFVSALLAGADFAKGSRFNSAGASDDITPVRRYGNKMLNLTVNRLFGTSFSDLCYGYNAFWARHLDTLAIDAPGFEIETLMSIRAAQAGLRIYEVPSHERLRQHGASNLSAVKDGWRILRLIAAEKRGVTKRKARKPKPFMAPARLAQDGTSAGFPDGQAWSSGLLNGSAGGYS
jgi:glycosyl transferase family 2